MREYRAARHWQPFDPTCRTTPVRSPCCGRRTPADTVLDCRHIKGTVARGGNVRPAKDHDWLCDGCVHLLWRDPSNAWTPSTLFDAMGAPDAIVVHHRARELAREKERADHAACLPHEPEKAWADAHQRATSERADRAR